MSLHGNLAQVCPAGDYDYRLTIEIPGVPFRYVPNELQRLSGCSTTTVTRSVDGLINVSDAATVTVEQVRTYLVNELAKDHFGKTVTITEFTLTAAKVLS